MKTINPSLWFDGNAEEAANYYVSIFPNSAIVAISRYGDEGPGPAGSVVTVNFKLNGQEFMGINGGPQFTFSEAISFLVNCETQDEVDTLWDKLGAGGTIQQCGWLKDKFGISWQIIPTILGELMQDKDPAKASSVTRAMLQMTKIDIAALWQAYRQA